MEGHLRAIVALAVGAAIALPSYLAARALGRYLDRRRDALFAKQFADRCHGKEPMDWPAVRSLLLKGDGTLILESYMPKGTCFYWWTPAQPNVVDASSGIPVPDVKTATTSETGAEEQAARRVATAFLDRAGTSISLVTAPPLEPRSAHLDAMSPLVIADRVRTVWCSPRGPFLYFKGDLTEYMDRHTTEPRTK